MYKKRNRFKRTGLKFYLTDSIDKLKTNKNKLKETNAGITLNYIYIIK